MNLFLYIGRLYLFSLLGLFATRLFLLLRHRDYFQSLSLEELFLSLGKGFEVDVITVNTWCGLFMLSLLLPWSRYQRYRTFISVLWFVLLSLMLIANVVDSYYFGYFHKHLDLGLVLMNNEADPIIEFAKAYWPSIIMLLLAIGALWHLWMRLADTPVESISTRKATYFLGVFLFLSYIVTGIRGFKLHGKPFGFPDTFSSGKLATSHLAISGFYNLYRSFGERKPRKIDAIPYPQAVKTTQKLLSTQHTDFVDPKNFPIKRQFIFDNADRTGKKYNYVIIMIESFSSRFIDGLNGNIGLGVTPNFDRILKNSTVFENAFANGRQSIAGITALFTGLIPPAGTSLYLGKGLERVRLSYLGTILKKNGYETLAMQSSKRRSFRIDSVAKIAGFDRYFGAEDFKTHQHGEDPDRMPAFGTWDGDMFNRFHKEINKLKEPFIAFTFTSSTHFPFILPSEKYEKYPHDDRGLSGLLNTFYYTDTMLGDFMNKAQKETWFKNTIFIFLADHTAPIPEKEVKKFEKNHHVLFPRRWMEKYRIPIVLYSPSLIKPSILKKPVSQASLFPSILSLSKIKDPFSTLSNPVFDKTAKGIVVVKSGEDYGIVVGNDHKTGPLGSFKGNSNISKYLISIFETLNYLYSNNRIY